MQKKIVIIAGISIVMIFLLSVAAIFWMNYGNADCRTAKIYQDGTLLYTIDLNTVTENYEITITGENGAYNIILVEHGQISMKEASCPDKLCVHMGKIHNASLPVTCLPNKVVLRIISDTENDTDTPDAIVY